MPLDQFVYDGVSDAGVVATAGRLSGCARPEVALLEMLVPMRREPCTDRPHCLSVLLPRDDDAVPKFIVHRKLWKARLDRRSRDLSLVLRARSVEAWSLRGHRGLV